MSLSSTFPGLGRRPRARDTSYDDMLGDLLGSDDDTAKKKIGVRSSPITTRGSPITTQKKDEDFYSTLAADVGDTSEMSEVSEADPAEIAKALEGVDDMDDQLLGSLKKKSSSSSTVQPKTEPQKVTRSHPESKANPVEEKKKKEIEDELSTLLNESLKAETTVTSRVSSAPAKAATKPKPKIDYGEFDEDDPLAGLGLSDEEDDPKPKKKPTPAKTTVETQKQAQEKDLQASVTANDSASTQRKAPVKKKREEVEIGDDLNVLDTLGFDDSPRDKKSSKSEDPEIQKAKSKVNELFGRGNTAKLLERPPTGERREFVLDKKYTKNKQESKEEDFNFGSYMPSAASTPGSRGGTAGSRRSVRFADDDDLSDSRGGSKKQSDWLGLGDSQTKSNTVDDWLGLAVGTKDPEPVKTKPSTTTSRPGPSPMMKRDESKVADTTPSAGADYLGLGADIDPDSLVQQRQITPPKRATTPDESGLDLFTAPAKRETSDVSSEFSDEPDSTAMSPRTAAMADHLAQISQMEATELPRKQEQPRPAAAESVKKIPQWRQEMKQKQQQQRQQQRSSPTMDSSFMPQPSMVSPSMSGANTDFIRQQEEMQRQMRKQHEEQLRLLQQQQQIELEKQLREQMRQQEEQQKLQEEVMKTQLQSAAPQMPLLANMSMNMTALQSQIRRLELEKEYLEVTLDNSKKRFQEDLRSLEATHRKRLQVYEEAAESREKRLKNENDDLVSQYTAKVKLLEQQKSDLIQSHHRKIMEYEDEKIIEINKLKELHRSALEEQMKDHQIELSRMKRTFEMQIDTIKGAHTHTRALQTVIDQVQSNAKELGSLQQRVESQHYANLDDREIEARQKDEQLKILQQRLARQQEENDQERSRLQELISRMENHMSEQSKQLEQERWKVKQEQSKLETLQIALDGERKILTEKMMVERAEIQKSKDSILAEQKAVMAQLYEERKNLATERAQLSASQKVLLETKQRDSAKNMQEEAEREGLMTTLASQKAEMAGKHAMLKQEAERLASQKRALESYKEELEAEKMKLQDVAEQIRKRSEEIADSVNEAARIKEEGELAMKGSRRIQTEHDQRLAEIQSQIQLLKATEKQIAQDRLNLAKEQRHLEELRKTVMCTKCGGAVNVYAGTNAGLMEQPQMMQPVSNQVLQHTPSSTVILDKDDGLQNLVAQAELDSVLRMWKLSAEKDKAFLEDESFYLETLKNSSLKTSMPYGAAQRV
ncbi:fas-binding factor 1 homolog isoform X2 [Ptychodera flava]|uniref:fas-binding factor 1 homolog isoform X2 n=1 Tax=Ptychodera flava TaxID=63121 RepID=UPI00396A85EF